MFAFTVMAPKLLHSFYLNMKYISCNSNLLHPNIVNIRKFATMKTQSSHTSSKI